MSEGLNRLTQRRFLAALPAVHAVQTKLVPVAVQIEQKPVFTKPPPSISRPNQLCSLALIEKFKIVTVYKPVTRHVVVDDKRLIALRTYDRVKTAPEHIAIGAGYTVHARHKRQAASIDLLRSIQLIRAQHQAAERGQARSRYRVQELTQKLFMEDAAVRHKFFESMNLRYMR